MSLDCVAITETWIIPSNEGCLTDNILPSGCERLQVSMIDCKMGEGVAVVQGFCITTKLIQRRMCNILFELQCVILLGNRCFTFVIIYHIHALMNMIQRYRVWMTFQRHLNQQLLHQDTY